MNRLSFFWWVFWPVVVLLMVQSVYAQLLPEAQLKQHFQNAYSAYPAIPAGLLEGVAWTQTRMQHILPANNPESCTEMPLPRGVMGLFPDGKGYFVPTLKVVAALSGFSEKAIELNPETNILAYAAAVDVLRRQMNIRSQNPEHFLPVLERLSEIPQDGNPVNDFARQSFLFEVFRFLNQSDNRLKWNFPARSIDLEKLFGKNNYQILSAPGVMIGQSSVQNRQGQSWQRSSRAPDYPPALWNPAPSCNYNSRAGVAITAVTVHTVQGSYAGCISWFQNCNSNVSAHYVIRSSDGQVTQMVLESDRAWHVGTENSYTIGIEHEGFVSDPAWYTPAMYNSSADLSRDITTSGYGINPVSTYRGSFQGVLNACYRIKGHIHYPNQSHTDPGIHWNWEHYYQLINSSTAVNTLTACTGTHTDPGGAGGNYANLDRRIWVIDPPGSTSLTLTFSSFALENNYDFLKIYNGTNLQAPLIANLTGSSLPAPVTASSGKMTLLFESDCTINDAGWVATWSCTSNPTPGNLSASVPTCSNGAYTVDFTWTNSGSGWFLDISSDPNFGSLSNKAISNLTATSAPAGFSNNLQLLPGTTYYWRIWNTQTHTSGPSFSVNACPDNIAPVSTVNLPSGWQTQNFTAQFTDTDNPGGSGVRYQLWQPIDFNGTDWRANASLGFFSDNFDYLHPDWTIVSGLWSAENSHLTQSDETNGNTQINAYVNHGLSDVYLYHWQMLIGGSGSNRRAGLHFFCDNPGLPNRGNSYFVWFRVDHNALQIYRVTNDVFNLEANINLAINENQWYDYKTTYNRATGEIHVWRDNQLIGSWTDPNPLQGGNYVSFRSGNALTRFNDLKVFRQRGNSETVTVGANQMLRYENPTSAVYAGRVKSISTDWADNISAIVWQDVNLDWTAPATVSVMDGSGASDWGVTISPDELSGSWSASSDQNSGIGHYLVSTGTSPGLADVAGWTTVSGQTSHTFSGLSLTDGQTYYFNVKAVNGAGLESPYTASNGIRAELSGYCANEGLGQPDATITQICLVQHGCFSGQSFQGYQLENNSGILLKQGETISFTLEHQTVLNNPVFWTVFADWNGDGLFAPIAELAGQTQAAPNTTTNLTITVPVQASEGPSRFRVALSSSGFVSPCIRHSGGQTFDLNFQIENGCPMPYVVSLNGTGTNWAELFWAGPAGLLWEIRLSTPGSPFVRVERTTNQQFLFNGLVPGLNYTASIRAMCPGLGMNSGWMSVTFATYPAREATGKIPTDENFQFWPNPVRKRLFLSGLPEEEPVRVRVYSVKGELICEKILSGVGIQSVLFDPMPASGTYWIELAGNHIYQTRKLVFLRE